VQENRELMELNKHLTAAEIILAIRYLDPDPGTKKTRADAGSGASIYIPLFTALAVALAYIGFYISTL
jgi:hypothetical protein